MEKIKTVKSSESSSIQSDFECHQNRNDAKLRRLKIQEEILTASVNKITLKCDLEEYGYKENVELRNYFQKIKKSYLEIKSLFQDVKAITKDRESLKNTDIDDIKKDILELDKKISSFKEFFKKEVTMLKVAEKEILLQIHEKPEENKFKSKCRVQIKPFNEVVPSPVRALINSPFKCVEVQRFQDFMKTNKRCGGWDEYNHNIFVQIWNKYFGDNVVEEPDKKELAYRKFKEEVCQKIFGINSNDIHSHTQWYNEYLNLKKCQEIALNKWRENRQKIKYPNRAQRKNVKYEISKDRSPNNDSDIASEEFLWDEISSPLDEISSEKSVQIQVHTKKSFESRLYNPTQQWTNKCQKLEMKGQNRFDIDEIEKLKIPRWRLNLKH